MHPLIYIFIGIVPGMFIGWLAQGKLHFSPGNLVRQAEQWETVGAKASKARLTAQTKIAGAVESLAQFTAPAEVN